MFLFKKNIYTCIGYNKLDYYDVVDLILCSYYPLDGEGSQVGR